MNAGSIDWRELGRAHQDAMVSLRRDLHAHPELAYAEHRTAGRVTAALDALDIPFEEGVGGTGVVGLVTGMRPGPVVAVRADMDALPFQDDKEVEYRSTVPGVAHLCGHDAHVAMQVGLAGVLAELRPVMAGTVKLVFEPAEEIMGVDTPAGARLLVEAGVLEDPPVDAMLGCHVYPDYPTGTVACRGGNMLAGMDIFRLEVLGRESHTAQSHEGRDAILAAAHIVTALQALVSREHPSTGVSSLNIGRIEGGKAINVLADRVVLEGSLRTADEEWRDGAAQRFERVVAGVAAAFDCEYRLRYDSRHLPATINDPALATAVLQTAADLYGAGAALRMPEPRLAAESFRFYAEKVPSAFWLLGVGNPRRGAAYASHHNRFDLDEDALSVGVAVTAATVWRLLTAPAVAPRPSTPQRPDRR